MTMRTFRFQRAWHSRRLPATVAVLLIAWSYEVQSEIDSPSKTNEVQAMSDFAERIRKIEEQIIDLTWISGLFQYPEFREIHEHPANYLSEAWEALRSPEFTDQQKMIIALSMQGLDLPRFLLFANDMLQLLESGLASYDVFKFAVFPPLEWNTKLAENYDQPDVARFLHRVLKSEKIEDRRKEIIRERILTGKVKLSVFNMRDTGLLR